MKQRDIYLVNLEPTKGSERSGTRPVVIISGDTMNINFNVCIVCPISSKVKNYPSCVQLTKSSLNNLQTDSEIITFQIRTISKHRFVKKIGIISREELEMVFAGLSDVLRF